MDLSFDPFRENLQGEPSLVLYLPLHQLDGDSFMSRDHYGHLATATGALWRPPGRSFDGLDDKIVVPDHPVLNFGAGNLTLAGWMRYPTSAASATRRLIYKSPAGGGNPRFTLAIQSTDQGFAAITDAAGNGAGLVGTIGIKDDSWHLLTASFERQSATGAVLMVDGVVDVLADPTAVGDISTPGRSVYIGTADTLDWFKGDIGEVWIYARALSFVEKINLYQATKWRYR